MALNHVTDQISSAELSSADCHYPIFVQAWIPHTDQSNASDRYLHSLLFFALSIFLILVWVVLTNFVCHTVALMRLSICSKIMQNAHFGQNGGHAQGGLYFDKY